MFYMSAVLLRSLALMRKSNEMRSTVSTPAVQPPPTHNAGNGAAALDVSSEVHDSPPAPPHPAKAIEQRSGSPLLAKLTSLTSIATVTAAAIVVVGIFAVVGGSYAKQVVHDQLVPQKITFPAAGSPALLPGIRQYAGQQLVDGAQAKAYANNFINVHLSEVAGGKTYAQVSTEGLAAPTNAKLATEKATLFQGETLRGLLLGAWGWSVVGTIASLAGWIMILLGAVLFVLPLANWQLNLRGRRGAPAGA